jgi:hypothetical protein
VGEDSGWQEITKAPDYRVWQWGAAGLKSLNGEPWLPQRRLAATCRASTFGVVVGRVEAAHGAHDAPQVDCTCGIYAAKSLDHLYRTGYAQHGIYGEVNLWGTVVEHELGWRASTPVPRTSSCRLRSSTHRSGKCRLHR